MNTACLLNDFFREKAHYHKAFQELLALQSAAVNQKTVLLSAENQKYCQNFSKAPVFPNGGENVRTIFMLDRSKLLMCLPLKTGTTNWQKTLASIMTYENSGLYLGQGLLLSNTFSSYLVI